MKRKGFTLLELLVVIIIVGVLATLGFQQYARVIEKSRGAEARAVLGSIRTSAAGHYLEHRALTGFNDDNAGIGAAADQIPSACRGSNYFSYGVNATGDTLTGTATRCTASGKTPDASTAFTLTLTSDFATGSDAWASDFGY
ncbi:MAG: prepilin-type N-terminal cleavage/methylation domain-containing protein [Candidatus Omnitrophica bacterium]|nr:prepilin-type N-terminal cleavage/methylation domain-containing protein [Candidatus Omnitrophota bacterium]MBU1870413.1 prepilin-type N-terminal cleavage/methylation domain-containing protein [Candidatus Omnitrophota bacterium]